MVEHAFGGEWTEIKLRCLKEYLTKYRTIFTTNQKARYFRTWYVDAFAGTGSRSTGISPFSLEQSTEDPETNRYFDGSAKIALGLPSPFNRYLFIEKSKARCDELKEMIDNEHKALAARCEFRQEDANKAIRAWCAERDWRKDRAVVFLDPYGLQVEWSTIQKLAATKGVDLWYLFPLNMRRLLIQHGQIDDAWQKRLDLLFGTHDWEARFYKPRIEEGLFGATETVERDATVKNITEFIEGRLRTCFPAVAKGLVLTNTRSSPLYSLCFAASNAKGAPIALRIAQSILGD
ncbi:MAG TPA: three-Cys-motif partner protein TcmP [Acidobacteriaceae bacterium]|jgi:three-Cys-motif partner protein|nr:three-Cys-motif partner protein TcmP [Acidobacteriaceae bacterium]